MTAIAPEPSGAPRYDAFISYSHAADGALAPALRDSLQRFAIPWSPLRIANPVRSLRIFLDRASLSATPGAWSTIERALRASEWFVMLASQDAACSPWVDRELDFWIRHKRVDRLLIVLTAGAIRWSATANDFDWAETDAVSPRLSGVLVEEPLWVDARFARTKAQASLADPRFRDLIAAIAAPLRNVPKDELIGKDIEQHRRQNAWRNGALVVLSALLVAVALAAFTAWRQRNRAEARLASVFETQARLELERIGDPNLALLYLAQASRHDATPARRSLIAQAIRRAIPETSLAASHASFSGSTLVTAGRGFAPRLWNVANHSSVSMPPEALAVVRAELSRDAKHVLTFQPAEDALGVTPDLARVCVWSAPDFAEHDCLADPVPFAELSIDGSLVMTEESMSTADARSDALGRSPPPRVKAQVWSIDDLSQPQRTLTTVPTARPVRFSGDGSHLVVVDEEQAASVYRMDGSEVARFAPATEAWLSPTGSKIVIYKNEVDDDAPPAQLCDVASGRCSDEFSAFPNELVFSTDGTRLAYVGSSGVEVWDVIEDRSVMRKPDVDAWSLGFAPGRNDRIIFAAEGTTQVWDADSSTLVGELYNPRACRGALSADGETVVTSCEDAAEVRLWRARPPSPLELAPTRLTSRWAGFVTFAWDGETMLVGGEGAVQIRDAASGKVLAFDKLGSSAQGYSLAPPMLVLLPRNRHGIALCPFAVASLGECKSRAFAGRVQLAALSPGGRRVVVCSGRALYVVDTETLWVERELDGVLGDVRAVVFSRDEELFATESQDRNTRMVQLWKLGSDPGQTVLPSGARCPGILGVDRIALGSRLAFDREGTRLVVACGDRAVVWDVARRAEMFSVEHGEAVRLVAFGGGDEQIVTIGGTAIRVWDAQRGAPLYRRESRSGGLHGITFDRPQRRFATVGRDDVKVWDLETGELLSTMTGEDFAGAAFDMAGARLATLERMGRVRVWDVRVDSRGPDELDQLLTCFAPWSIAPDGQAVRVTPDPTKCRW